MTNRAMIALHEIDENSEWFHSSMRAETLQYKVDPKYENGWGVPSDAVQDLVDCGLVVVHKYEPAGMTITYEITPKGREQADAMREILG